ncbi:MAG: FHIPEP family type III secretion protein, partial [Candidatus Acidiferrales bacterium]
VETREPAFGVPARWIPSKLRDVALGAGYAVVEQTSVIATHLAEVIRRHAHEVLTRQETKRLLDALSDTQPKLVEELVPRVLSLGEVEKILQQLLREQVSIRNMPAILETLIDASSINRNVVSLVEAVRQTLGRALVQPLLQEDGKLKVLAVGAALEEEITRSFDPQAAATRTPAMQSNFLRRILEGLRRIAGDQIAVASPVLLCGSPARFHLRRLLEPFVPRIVVISPAEIPAVVSVQSLGVVQ